MNKGLVIGIAVGVALAATVGVMAGYRFSDDKPMTDVAAQQAEAAAALDAAGAPAPEAGDAASPEAAPEAATMAAVSVPAASVPASAKSRYAEVLSATPVSVSERVAREQCHDEQVTRQKPVKDEKRVAGAVIGAVVGGVLGNQVGGGDGKKIATVAGAAAGGYAGSKAQKAIQENNTETVTVQKCETVYDTKQTDAGYDVKYRYNGKVATVRMDTAPVVGSLLPVKNGEVVGSSN